MFDVGEESKTANAAKISINFLLVSMLEALSESFLLMEKYGLEQKQFLEIANALFGSPYIKITERSWLSKHLSRRALKCH